MIPTQQTNNEILIAILDYIETGDFTAIYSIINSIMGIAIIISVPFCLMLLMGIIYSVERLKTIRRKESLIFEAKPKVENDAKEIAMSPAEKKFTDKWTKILVHADSSNQNDWRLAIIEADIILGEILEKLGYQGESIGEMLKRVAKGDFKTLDEAWEAHKVRNAIAHQGSDLVLTQREAKRVIGLYQKVFEEFQYI